MIAAILALSGLVFGFVLLMGLVVWRLRYNSRDRAYMVNVDSMVLHGEQWWVAWLGDKGPEFASKDEDRAVAYALEWQAAELRGTSRKVEKRLLVPEMNAHSARRAQP